MFWCCCGNPPTEPEIIPAVTVETKMDNFHKRAGVNTAGVITSPWVNAQGYSQKLIPLGRDTSPNSFVDTVNFQNWWLGPTFCSNRLNNFFDSENFPLGNLEVGYNCGLLSQSFDLPIGTTIAEAYLTLTQDGRQPTPPAWPLYVAVYPVPDHHRWWYPAQFPWANTVYNDSPSFGGVAFQPHVTATLGASTQVNLTSQIQTVVSSPGWRTAFPEIRRSTSIIVLCWVPYRQTMWINNITTPGFPSWPQTNSAVWCADGDRQTSPLNCTLIIKV